MAAPPTKTLKDLNGKWVMNKELSDSPDPALAVQGIGWLTRKAVCMATVTLHVHQYEGGPAPPAEAAGAAQVTRIDIEQTATAGLKGTSEYRCLDGVLRPHKDYLFGSVRGRSRWLAAADIDDAWLAAAGAWLEGEAERSGPAGETHILSHVESVDAGWTATQVWGFQLVGGERRYVRQIVVAKQATGERAEIKLVYDYIP